jgi:hypothetical protein
LVAAGFQRAIRIRGIDSFPQIPMHLSGQGGRGRLPIDGAGPRQDSTEYPSINVGIRGQPPGGVDRLSNAAGNAIQRSFQEADRLFFGLSASSVNNTVPGSV